MVSIAFPSTCRLHVHAVSRCAGCVDDDVTGIDFFSDEALRVIHTSLERSLTLADYFALVMGRAGHRYDTQYILKDNAIPQYNLTQIYILFQLLVYLMSFHAVLAISVRTACDTWKS